MPKQTVIIDEIEQLSAETKHFIILAAFCQTQKSERESTKKCFTAVT
jgi:hypothetical protein